MVNYGEAFKRPFRDLKKLVIGIILAIIPIVNLIAIGYILTNTKSAMRKNYQLTEWGNWADLFVKGLLYVVISVIYILPALALLLLMFGVALLQMSRGIFNPAIVISHMATFGVEMIVFLSLLILAIYLIPAAVLNYIVQNRFGAAFDFSTIKKRAFKGEYFAAWFVGGVFSVAVAVILSFIPIIGYGIASFITMMTFYTMVAEAWASK